MQLRLPTAVSLALASLTIGLASPVAAQSGPAYPPPPPPYNGYAAGWQGSWAGPQGQVYQADPSRAAYAPPQGIDHSITREGWLDGCRQRLDQANQGHDAPGSYDGACQGWLSYYEQMGYAADGYGFSYAIPVTVTTIPGHCEPCPPEPHYIAPRHHWVRPLADKRIPLSGKRVRVYQ